jgi:hypothetical protein
MNDRLEQRDLRTTHCFGHRGFLQCSNF